MCPCAASLQVGATPLHDAAITGNNECLRLLLEASANKEATNNVRPLLSFPCGVSWAGRTGTSRPEFPTFAPCALPHSGATRLCM